MSDLIRRLKTPGKRYCFNGSVNVNECATRKRGFGSMDLHGFYNYNGKN